jgi:hypothetical protein
MKIDFAKGRKKNRKGTAFCCSFFCILLSKDVNSILYIMIGRGGNDLVEMACMDLQRHSRILYVLYAFFNL